MTSTIWRPGFASVPKPSRLRYATTRRGRPWNRQPRWICGGPFTLPSAVMWGQSGLGQPGPLVTGGHDAVVGEPADRVLALDRQVVADFDFLPDPLLRQFHAMLPLI